MAIFPEQTFIGICRVQQHQVGYPMGQQGSGKKCTKMQAFKTYKNNGQCCLVHFYCPNCELSDSYCVENKVRFNQFLVQEPVDDDVMNNIIDDPENPELSMHHTQHGS